MSGQLPFVPPDRRLDLDELREIAAKVAEQSSLWRDGLVQTSRERTYVDVFTNDYLGVWAISWVEHAHDTGFHDHDVSGGAVHVVEGAIRHEHLRLGDRPVGKAVHAGEGFCFDNTFIHRMRPEPGAGATVTIHAYSPPLIETGQYGEGHDGLLHRIPSPAEEQLKPHGDQGTPSDAEDSLSSSRP
ncbi:hypothetical protein L3Q67_24775 [Saccharothrix sp. AJ9571]|nr:hypothetical protein L3Q67_24775 [Saccharothrix sp. AJ9571]